MTIPEIRRVCYVGAGTMGCYNSIAAALKGYDVVLFDIHETALQEVPHRHLELAQMLIGGGHATADDLGPALKRVTLSTNLEEALAAADLISESVAERLHIKRELHAQIDQLCNPQALLTTNTSALPVSQIEDVVCHGERFAALHSHLGSPLVDIVRGPRTSDATVDILERYVSSVNGVPLILRREYPGYALNAMLGPVLRTALQLLADGCASIEQIDAQWMRSQGAPIGPFGLMDLFGINIIEDSWSEARSDAFSEALRPRILEVLRSKTSSGELGVKSGCGFYNYPDPAYQQASFQQSQAVLPDIENAFTATLIGHGILIAAADVLDPVDIDRAWTVGMYMPQGPFAALSHLGVPAFTELMTTQAELKRFDSQRAAQALDYIKHSQ